MRRARGDAIGLALGGAALFACGGSTGDAGGSTSSGSGGASSSSSSGGADGGEDGANDASSCPVFEAPVKRGIVQSAALTEASGLVASARNDGVLFAHNDSGDTARLFALRASDAVLLGIVDVEGASATDWEAIAHGPAAGGPGLYIGDIGDNAAARPKITVYVVPEPVLPTTKVTVERAIDLTWEDGPRDTEALFVDPADGTIGVVTKTVGVSEVYVAEGGVLRKKGAVDFGAPGKIRLVTDASVTRAGDAILLRNYGGADLWRRRPGEPLWRALLSPPCPIPVATEPQGEAIAFSLDGRGYFTISENVSQPLWFVAPR